MRRKVKLERRHKVIFVTMAVLLIAGKPLLYGRKKPAVPAEQTVTVETEMQTEETEAATGKR